MCNTALMSGILFAGLPWSLTTLMPCSKALTASYSKAARVGAYCQLLNVLSDLCFKSLFTDLLEPFNSFKTLSSSNLNHSLAIESQGLEDLEEFEEELANLANLDLQEELANDD